MECVQFTTSEEQVVAGSQSGSLRIWDLEAAKSEFCFFHVERNSTLIGIPINPDHSCSVHIKHKNGGENDLRVASGYSGQAHQNWAWKTDLSS